MRIISAILMVCLASGRLAAPAAQAGEIAPSLLAPLARLAPGDSVPVIVHLSEQVDPADFTDRDRPLRRARLIRALIARQTASQRSLIAFLQQRGAGRIVPFWIRNGVAARVPAAAVTALAALPGVERVTLDATVSLDPGPAAEVPAGATADTEGVEWNVDAVNAPTLWSLGWDGNGVVVGTLDTGADVTHPDIGPAFRGGNNSWYDPNGEHAAPYDASGHGTQVVGLIVGGSAGGTAIGVAPGATWIAAKIFDDAGDALTSRIHLAFQWMLDPDGNPDTDDAPQVVNNSWILLDSRNQCVTEFAGDIDVLRAAGIAVVFGAGNGGPASPSSMSPADNPGSFAVGSVNSNLSVALTSSRGPSACDGDIYPEVAAPGQLVRTADPDLGYKLVQGTSFAAPHAAGAMALLKNAYPGAAVSLIESALIESAADLPPVGADNASGAGLIDAAAALAWLDANASSSEPGQVQFSSGTYSASESTPALSLTVTRTEGSAGEISVQVAAHAGTADTPADFTLVTDSLTFGDGVTRMEIEVAVSDDGEVEDNEDFSLALYDPTGGSLIGAPATATVIIRDNDTAVPQPGTLQFSADAYGAIESDGSLRVTVMRSGGSDGTVRVDYAAADGTATAGDDYTLEPGTLTFADGQLEAGFSLTLVDDGFAEGDEQLSLALSNPSGGAVLGAPATATVTLADDDGGGCPAPVRIAGSPPVYFWNLEQAYLAAQSGDTIQMRATDIIGGLTADRPEVSTLTLAGGYSCDYSAGGGVSTLHGAVLIGAGSLNWSGLSLTAP